jgi:hypothetical protein
VDQNSFVIRTNKLNVEVSCQVTGIRQDAYANAHRIEVEEDKPQQEQGHYPTPDPLAQLRNRPSLSSAPDTDVRRDRTCTIKDFSLALSKSPGKCVGGTKTQYQLLPQASENTKPFLRFFCVAKSSAFDPA